MNQRQCLRGNVIMRRLEEDCREAIASNVDRQRLQSDASLPAHSRTFCLKRGDENLEMFHQSEFRQSKESRLAHPDFRCGGKGDDQLGIQGTTGFAQTSKRCLQSSRIVRADCVTIEGSQIDRLQLRQMELSDRANRATLIQQRVV